MEGHLHGEVDEGAQQHRRVPQRFDVVQPDLAERGGSTEAQAVRQLATTWNLGTFLGLCRESGWRNRGGPSAAALPRCGRRYLMPVRRTAASPCSRGRR